MKLLADTNKKPLSQVDQLQVTLPEENACDWKHKSLISILFVSLTIGCVLQIYGITREYLSAPTTVSIEVNFDQDHVQIPALSFCTNTYNPGMQSTDFYGKGEMSIVEYIKVTPSTNGQTINFTHYMDNLEESISQGYYCFTPNSALKDQQIEIEKGQQVKIKLTHFGEKGNWWVYIHNSYDVPSSYEWNAVEVRKGFYVEISYTHESYQQMDTNCVNYYQNTEYTSRKDCIRKCKLRESLNKCGAVFNGIDVKKSDESVKFAENTLEKLCAIDLREEGEDCTRNCHQKDCQIDSYKPYLISKYNNNWDYTVIQLSPPNTPELIYKQKTSFDGRVHFFYLSTNLIVWLGLALYLLYNKCSKTSVKEKFCQVYTVLNFPPRSMQVLNQL